MLAYASTGHLERSYCFRRLLVLYNKKRNERELSKKPKPRISEFAQRCATGTTQSDEAATDDAASLSAVTKNAMINCIEGTKSKL